MNVVLDDGADRPPAGEAAAALPLALSSAVPVSTAMLATASRDKRLRSERLAAQGYVISSGQSRLRPYAVRLLPPLTGLALLLLVWSIAAATVAGFPAPVATWEAAAVLFDAAWRRDGVAGIAWQVLASLRRLGLGFGMAAVIGIPLGFVAGRLTFVARVLGPVVGLFKPVAPLACLPVGLLIFKAGGPAIVAVIAIAALWPMLHHTAAGVRRVPHDYMNVARVLNLSEWKILSRIQAPAALPHILVGARRAAVAAWMVAVAAEMLDGGPHGLAAGAYPGLGLGFRLRAAWDAGDMAFVLIAIVLAGLVGLVLELVLAGAAKVFTYADVE
jgi:nitrate/nitrite transport system permease protein